jgi:hypothetical protein
MLANMTFTINTGLAYQAGDNVQLSYDADNFVIGVVVSYDKVTGVLVITPTAYEGTGTYNTWVVSLTGASGSSGTSGSVGTAGLFGTSGSSANSSSSGESGSSATSGDSKTSGTSGESGSTGTSGTSGTKGSSASSGNSGADASSGASTSSGTSGNPGGIGSSGSSGTSGTSGSIGTSNSSGVSGLSGLSRASGVAGSSGTSGGQGPQGPTGAQGPIGAQGPQGAGGTSGSSGVNGGPGPTGAQGPQGGTGPQGPTGAQGPQGPTGAPGPTGATGPQGPANSNNQSLNASNNAVFEGGITTSEWYVAGRFYQGAHRGMISPTTPTFFGENFGWYTFASIGSTYFFSVSTEEVKTNIQPFTASAIGIIDSTEIVTFKYELDGQDNTTRIGFIAENTPEELATKDHDKMDINSSLGLMIKAIQELDAKLAEKEK